MRSLQHDLGKRSPLFFDFNAGVSFNPSAYTALDFNKIPVTEPITLTSSAAAPIDNTPAAFFTSSVNNPNTAYSFDNNVSLKPWTADDSANSSWAGLGAFGTDGNTSLSFGTDGNIKFDLSDTSNVYKEANKQNAETEKRIAELNAKQQEANAKNTQSLLAMFAQLIQMGAKMAASSDSGAA
jgi:hypothetical protein